MHTLQPSLTRYWQPGTPTHSLIVAGKLAVSVRLHGKNAKGRCMILDETDWTRVRLVIGERWMVSKPGERGYVKAYGGKAGLMGPNGVTLARWLTWAEPSEVVLYRDKDALNLTRANLVTVERSQALEALRAMRGGQNDLQPGLPHLSGQEYVPTGHPREVL